MSDRPRYLGRTGGSTSLPAYAITVHDDGPEPERVDKDFENAIATDALSVSEALRERNIDEQAEARVGQRRSERTAA